MAELLVNNISPSKDQLKKAGITVTECKTDPSLETVILPEGWTISEWTISGWSIYDFDGNMRGYYNIVGGVSTISLRTYYRPMLEDLGENKYKVYFGNDNGPLFQAGTVDGSDYYKLVSRYLASRDSRDWGKPYEAEQKSYEADLSAAAKEFNDAVISVCDRAAATSYPGWNDVNNYWPKSLEKENGKN